MTLFAQNSTLCATRDDPPFFSPVCTFFKQRVSAIIGPTSPAVMSLTKSACTNLNVPHLQTTWQPASNRNPYTLNLFPDPEVFSRAFVDLIVNKKWKSFTVLYENQQSKNPYVFLTIFRRFLHSVDVSLIV